MAQQFVNIRATIEYNGENRVGGMRTALKTLQNLVATIEKDHPVKITVTGMRELTIAEAEQDLTEEKFA